MIKKTKTYKNTAFVYFKNKKVANIAAKTMNNYIMFGKTLSAKIIPDDRAKIKKIFMVKCFKKGDLKRPNVFASELRAKKEEADIKRFNQVNILIFLKLNYDKL